jgi:hypothetical protein
MLYTAPDGLSEFISPDWKQHLKKIRNKRRRRKKKEMRRAARAARRANPTETCVHCGIAPNSSGPLLLLLLHFLLLLVV